MSIQPSAALTPDVCLFSALELAQMIRTKKISAREVLAAHLKQIERVNPKVNAIVSPAIEAAQECARRADEATAAGKPLGLLHGLPIAHKDLQPTKDIPTTFGSRIFQDFLPENDSLTVERLKRAGAITVGKTNTPELGAGSQTFNEVFGATCNPYDLGKTCGGSSGGAAVALATYMLPIADGSDMGGSLRNPASFCNVVGMRTSPGRVPVWPAPMGWSTFGVDGPMARSVADAAFLLSAMAGPDARSPISLQEPGELFAAPLQRDFRRVRVAWWKGLGGLPFDPQVRQVVNEQRRVFESLGCIVEEAEPDFTGTDNVFKILRAWLFVVRFAEMAKLHRPLIKDTILWEIERGEKLTAREIGDAEVSRTGLFHRMRKFMETYEFFIMPVCQVLPFDINQPYVAEIDGVKMSTYIDWMKSCYYISTLGNPALSLPCGFSREGLPIGLQIVGRHRDDWGVLQIGHAVEQLIGPSLRRMPPVILGN
ncbi:MAG TPA: amidase [Candidatus Angelobacter sp.]|nr:amidase [Candidatus Angelobacter sp.]